ncbi:MAG: hypothetical protein KAS93_00800, partial [Gammaproteobacteria bacterium]|nr:hypothetical protein [Gammaproteobacteria bacterium]
MGRKNWFLFGFANDDISSDGAVGWRSKIVKMITPLSLPFYIALFSVTLVIFLHSYCQAIIISMQHLDGAYQTFSALDRIAHGQAFGKDFFSYLGIGVMYSLYPVFMVLGKNVFASTFAAFLLAKITALFSLFTLVYFGFLGRLSKKASLLLAIIIYSMVVLMLLLQFGLVKHYALPLFISVFQPGNSLYPLRSFIPFIVVWGLYCLLSKSHRSFIWLGLLGCLCLLWSNDFAVPTLIFLFFIYGVYNFAFSVVFAKEMLFALFVSLVSYIVLLFVILKGSMWAWFVYNYQGVLKDQGWYFAPYSASFRYFSLEHFLVFWKGRGPCYFPLLLAIPMLLGLFCYAVKKKNLYAYLIVFLGGVSLFAGMLSEIAGHISNHYYSRYIQVYYFMFIPFVLIALQFLPIKKAMAKVASYFRKTLKLRIKYYKNLLLYGLSVLVTVALVI